jgi:hypothetical protein
MCRFRGDVAWLDGGARMQYKAALLSVALFGNGGKLVLGRSEGLL